MEAREDEDMTEVSTTSSEITSYTRKKGLMHSSELHNGGPALHEKNAPEDGRRQRMAELAQRRLEARAARIEELRARVGGGTYEIDSLAVAQRIQDSALMPIIMGKDSGKLPRLPRLSRPRGAC